MPDWTPLHPMEPDSKPTSSGTCRPSVVLLGLDGADFGLVDRLIELGKLPNLQKLREEGASGVLQSTYPSFTAPAWTSFITGLWPGKHGIFNFQSLSPG
ncbi:MAG: alkaline phosphatase family protein, partial [Chloroflexi bacterium]|nr:alkaline phosphatase family protein [Chloroflexota bacterium]